MLRMPTLLALAPAGACLIVGLYYFALFDPFEWGIVQSSRFSWQKFATIREGDSIDKVIERLGEPIGKPYPLTAITDDPAAPCVSSGPCTKYLFAGARWGASFKEAIVVTNRTGRVIGAQARQE